MLDKHKPNLDLQEQDISPIDYFVLPVVLSCSSRIIFYKSYLDRFHEKWHHSSSFQVKKGRLNSL